MAKHVKLFCNSEFYVCKLRTAGGGHMKFDTQKGHKHILTYILFVGADMAIM